MKHENDSSTEENILAAAHEVFLAKGLDGARMQEIADKAKINKAMLHYYYRSKEQLFQKVFRSEAHLLLDSTIGLMKSDEPIVEKIKRLVEIDLEICTRKPDLAMFVLSELKKNQSIVFSNGQVEQLRAAFLTFRKQLKDEIKAGKIREVSAEHLILNIISLTQFPFIGEPLMVQLLNIKDKNGYKKILNERRDVIVELLTTFLQK